MTPPDLLLWFAVVIALIWFAPYMLTALVYLAGGLFVGVLALIDKVTPS